jgi:pimeloyl-ACP methyl ester carboxylesterase
MSYVTKLHTFELEIDGLPLKLHRFKAPGNGAGNGNGNGSGHGSAVQSVLLLHGGNTNSRLYTEPHGGLVRYLAEHGCDVWTMDWRGSSLVLKEVLRRELSEQQILQERELYTLDRVAQYDIPQALRKMRELGVKGDISVLGFCLAGGALSMAIARGHLEGLAVGNVALVTLGLFCEVPWNGWVKAEDFIIERFLATAPRTRCIDPAAPGRWPKELASAYDRWPRSWLGTGNEPIDELFKRLTFMYGEPYARPRLTRAFERGLIEGFFGPVHLGLYLHGGQIVRRGYCAKFNALDVVDRTRIKPGTQQVAGSDLLAPHFRTKRVTSFAGADDRLWHRDSMDLTYEWLRNEAQHPEGYPDLERTRHRKHVFSHYGHLDLFWSEDAVTDVYKHFLKALTQPSLPLARPARLPLSPPNSANEGVYAGDAADA